MLELYTRKGMHAGWLPTAEGGQGGTGTELSDGILDVKDGHKYLPFVKNGINYVETMGRDVVSYNFTGCIMAMYVTAAGSRRVCHVSTGAGQDCKAAWDRIKASAKKVKEFKPHEHISTQGIAFKGCYGIITADDRCFSVTMVQQNGQAGLVSVVAEQVEV
jgi:hypothetical protein